MNIFFLSINPKDAAQQAIDKHVVKMILESAQMLYTAQWVNENRLVENPNVSYKIVHKNHPSTIWARSSIHNYNWLCELALAYCEEYKHRYSTVEYPREHSTQKHLEWLYKNPPILPDAPFTEPPQCMPQQYKTENCIQAYRNYYIGEKLPFSRYTKREPPNWFKPYLTPIL